MNKNILITGGTGLVGSKLTKVLIDKGYNVGILSRKKTANANVKCFFWDYTKNEIDINAIKFADVIVNLVGENISNKKWTKEQKLKIIQSRVKSVELLKSKFIELNKKDFDFISASAIGYYGTFTSDKLFYEDDDAGKDFLSDVVKKWENAVDELIPFANRVLKFRIGVVLSSNGGALPKMLNVTKKGIGSALGQGNQYMPWISLDDLVRLFVYSIENIQLKGVYNAVSPIHITNKEFMQVLAKSLQKPFFMPNVPEFVLKAMYGKMSSLLLYGSRVSSGKLVKTGFIFKDDLNAVLSKL
ncbi:MAG: TIGR01777 family oxidoreductase [Bacteroidales bacterium]|nr:TIGR01777 family oxidoreductase [Bacteroidales bacterium]